MGGEKSDATSASKRVSKAGENSQVNFSGEPDHIPQQTGKDTPLHPPGHGVRLY